MRRRAKFTLIELLTVISIAAVLFALLLPGLAKAKDAARRISCASSLSQCGIATRSYCDDNADFIPWGPSWQGVASHVASTRTQSPYASGDWLMHGYLFKHSYLAGRNAMRCPGDPQAQDPGSGLTLNPWGWQASYAYMGSIQWPAHALGSSPGHKLSAEKGSSAMYLDDPAWRSTGSSCQGNADFDATPYFHSGGVNVLHCGLYAKFLPTAKYVAKDSWAWKCFDDSN